MTIHYPLRIFVGGPYTAETPKETEENVRRAIDIALVLREKGHYPFIPHLFHFVEQRITEDRRHTPIDYEGWMDWCAQYLDACDAFYFCAPSPGTNREIVQAADRGKQIFTRLHEVPYVDRRSYADLEF